jgi:hypothetical protein
MPPAIVKQVDIISGYANLIGKWYIFLSFFRPVRRLRHNKFM